MKFYKLDELIFAAYSEDNPLIARLEEFNDSPSGVAAFLDDLETRDIKVPILSQIPDLAEYGRPLTEYLLFLHEITTSLIVVVSRDNGYTSCNIDVQVSVQIEPTTEILQVVMSYLDTPGRKHATLAFDPRDPIPPYDYTIHRIKTLIGQSPPAFSFTFIREYT